MPPKKKVRFSNELHCAYIPSRQDSTVQIPFHDPIGMHLMALRTFYRGLLVHKNRRKRTRTGFMKRFKRPKMPEYPPDYPTSSYLYSLRVKRSRLNQRPQLRFRGKITKAQVDDIRTFAIKRILLMVGYEDLKFIEGMIAVEFDQDDNNDLPLKHLSNVCDLFLKSFVERLRFHKDSVAFRDDIDIWDPLETTLQEWGFGGVRGIAKYFYNDFTKMAERLSADCIHLVKEDKKKEKAEKAGKQGKLQKKIKKKQHVEEDDSEITLIEDNVCFMEIDNTGMITQMI